MPEMNRENPNIDWWERLWEIFKKFGFPPPKREPPSPLVFQEEPIDFSLPPWMVEKLTRLIEPPKPAEAAATADIEKPKEQYREILKSEPFSRFPEPQLKDLMELIGGIPDIPQALGRLGLETGRRLPYVVPGPWKLKPPITGVDPRGGEFIEARPGEELKTMYSDMAKGFLERPNLLRQLLQSKQAIKSLQEPEYPLTPGEAGKELITHPFSTALEVGILAAPFKYIIPKIAPITEAIGMGKTQRGLRTAIGDLKSTGNFMTDVERTMDYEQKLFKMLEKTTRPQWKMPTEAPVLQEIKSVGELLGKKSLDRGSLAKYVLEKGKRLTFQAKNLVKSPEAKEIINDIELIQGASGRRLGTGLEEFGKTGLFKLTKEESKKLGSLKILRQPSTDSKLNMLNRKVDGVFHRMYLEAKNKELKVKEPTGEWRPIGEVEQYMPRTLKHEIRKAIFDDIFNIRREAQKVAKTGGFTEQVFAEQVNRMFYGNKVKPITRKAIEHSIKKGEATSPIDAIIKMEFDVFDQIYRTSGFLERPRKLTYPLPYYETNLRKVAIDYTQSWAHKISEVERWGQNWEKLNPRLELLSMEEQGIMGEVLARHTGQIQKLKGLSPGFRKAIDAYMGFEVGTKIGLGTASLVQTTQPLISFITEAGLIRSVKGGARLLDAGYRSFIRKSGAPARMEPIRALAGEKPGGAMGKFAEFTTKWSGFKGLNQILQYWSASSGDVFIRELYKIANKPGLSPRKNWARDRLKDLHINYKNPLTAEKRLESMYKFAMDNQLQKNILNEPLWMNNPRTSWLSLFKRFGYRQFTYQKDLQIRELKRGNVMPLLRLTAGGYLGGELIIGAKNKIRSFLRGEPVYRTDDKWWIRALNNYAGVGSLGMITDLSGTRESTVVGMIGDAYGDLSFQAMPVGAKDVGDIYKVGDAFFRDWKKRGVLQAMRRQAPRAGELGGVLARYGMRRFKTEEQKQNYYQSLKSRTRQRAYDRFLTGDKVGAVKIIKQWNDEMSDVEGIYPEYFLEISDKEVERERKRRLKLYGKY